MRITFLALTILIIQSSVFSQKITRAVSSYQDQKYEKALELFQDILQKDKSDLAALIGVSKCMIAGPWLDRYTTEKERIEQWSIAFEFVQQAIDVYPRYTSTDIAFIGKSFSIYSIQDLYTIRNDISVYLWNNFWVNEASLAKLDSFLTKHGSYLSSLKSNIDLRRSELIFKDVMASPSIDRLNAYLKQYPNSAYYRRVFDKLDTLYYDNALSTHTLSAYREYLKKFTSSSLAGDIKERYLKLRMASIGDESSIEEINSVISEFSQAEFRMISITRDAVNGLRQKLEKKEYERAILHNTAASYQSFLASYPRSTYSATVKYKLTVLRYDEIVKNRSYFQLPALYSEYPLIIDFSSPFITDLINQLSESIRELDITPFIQRFVADQLSGLDEPAAKAAVTFLKASVDVTPIFFDTIQLKRFFYAKGATRLSSNEDFYKVLLKELISPPDLAYRCANGFYQNGQLEFFVRSASGEVRKFDKLFVNDGIVSIPLIPRINSYFDQIRTQYSVVSATKPFISGGSGTEVQTTSYAFTSTDAKCCPSIRMVLGYEYQSSGQLIPSRIVGLYRHSGELPNTTSGETSLNWVSLASYIALDNEITSPDELSGELNQPVGDIGSNNDESKIYEKVEIEASFPGGDAKWRQYLERNANAQVAAENGAPEGAYTTIVLFVVDSDGSISNVRALTNHGYGIEEEAIRIIKRGPKWNPAIQNGRQVRAYRRQPITFYVNGD
jgi:hypothetical protein